MSITAILFFLNLIVEKNIHHTSYLCLPQLVGTDFDELLQRTFGLSFN